MQAIDVRHLGRERVICCWRVGDVLIDPGPGVLARDAGRGAGRRAAAGAAAHAHPPRPRGRGRGDRATLAGGRRVRARARRAATSRIPRSCWPARSACTATDMERLWGEVVPGPGGRTSGPWRAARRSTASASPTRRATPRTTSAISTRTADARSSATSPACGSSASDLVLTPTPPPDIDLEAWNASLVAGRRVEARVARPHALRLGRRALAQLATVRDRLARLGHAGARARRRRLRGAHPRGGRRRGRPGDGRRLPPGGSARAAVARSGPLLAQARSGVLERRGRGPDRGYPRGMSQTIELPRTRGPGSGLGEAWRVIVRNDDHNTFDHVAHTLAASSRA